MQLLRAAEALAEEDVRSGLEQIFLQHKDLIFRAAYRITGSAGDAEDVLQTVFLRLVRQENWSEIDNLQAYLHRSALNASLDLLRRRKETRTLSLDDEQSQVAATSVNSAHSSAEIRDWLREALARLNPRWAEMFVLRFIEDFTNREIAQVMNTSPAVVAVVLHRTRARLKKDFKNLARRRR